MKSMPYSVYSKFETWKQMFRGARSLVQARILSRFSDRSWEIGGSTLTSIKIPCPERSSRYHYNLCITVIAIVVVVAAVLLVVCVVAAAFYLCRGASFLSTSSRYTLIKTYESFVSFSQVLA